MNPAELEVKALQEPADAGGSVEEPGYPGLYWRRGKLGRICVRVKRIPRRKANASAFASTKR
jgi:hypothetical protein